MRANRWICGVAVLAAFVTVLALPVPALAHCDREDGPVIKAAQRALATGDVNLILIWVQKQDEGEVRKAFEKAQALRKLSSDAREMADHYFFETVVRIHRVSEGAAYTGVKSPDSPLDPAVAAADEAIDEGSPVQLLILLNDAVQDGTQRQYQKVASLRNYKSDDVEAGREYVHAYTNFVHYVEALHKLATARELGHKLEMQVAEEHH